MTTCTANFERTDAASIDLVRMAIEPLLDGQTDVLNRILAVLEASLQGAVDHKSDGPIELIVTQSIQRNFEQRGMYPQFRPEFAAKVLPSKAGVYFVSLEQAEELLQYAQEQRKKMMLLAERLRLLRHLLGRWSVRSERKNFVVVSNFPVRIKWIRKDVKLLLYFPWVRA